MNKKEQNVIHLENYDSDLHLLLREIKSTKLHSIMLVCGNSFINQKLYTELCMLLKENHIEIIRFSSYKPNPAKEDVMGGLEIFENNKCDMIIAAGGGSAMDVAKCIKLYSQKNPFLAVIPTTAGSGSEATRFAVIYEDGKKLSVTGDDILPQLVIMDGNLMASMPEKIKNSSLCDAIFHCIESYWSVLSTEESRDYARRALKLILNNIDKYLDNDENVFESIQMGAYYAGKAINISQTTAGHALSYKLTSIYGIQHGFAVANVDKILVEYNLNNLNKCIDTRGEKYLTGIMNELGEILGVKKTEDLPVKINELVKLLKVPKIDLGQEDIENLVTSVNPDRLKNHPISLNTDDIRTIYKKIFAIK